MFKFLTRQHSKCRHFSRRGGRGEGRDPLCLLCFDDIFLHLEVELKQNYYYNIYNKLIL